MHIRRNEQGNTGLTARKCLAQPLGLIVGATGRLVGLLVIPSSLSSHGTFHPVVSLTCVQEEGTHTTFSGIVLG